MSDKKALEREEQQRRMGMEKERIGLGTLAVIPLLTTYFTLTGVMFDSAELCLECRV